MPSRQLGSHVRIVLVVIGIVVALAGCVWALQGVGLILGSFMSNNPSWIWIGTATALVGFGLVGLGSRAGTAAKKV